jgi:aspartate kinase
MTDDLIARAREISARPPAREMDMLMAVGEQISIALLSMAIHELGQGAISLTGSQVRILTDGVHTKARVLEVDRRRIDEELGRNRVVVVAGFQGVTPDHEITTLGRGGSDVTAVALASALGADSCEIYTDVPGVFTADPRIEPDARKLDRLSYDEMLEMASSGAVVLQTRSVEYAKAYGVRAARAVDVERRTRHGGRGGPCDGTRSLGHGVAHDLNVGRITIRNIPDIPASPIGFSRRWPAGINVDMIVQTASRDGRADISFTVTKADAQAAEEVTRLWPARSGGGDVAAAEDVAKISVVGAGMASNPVSRQRCSARWRVRA